MCGHLRVARSISVCMRYFPCQCLSNPTFSPYVLKKYSKYGRDPQAAVEQPEKVRQPVTALLFTARLRNNNESLPDM